MSHVVIIDVEIKSLEALIEAGKACGLQFMEGQQTFKWYGTHVGDYPLPAGFTKADMGKCEHALRVIGNDNAYEIGICKRRDGKAGYVLLYDFWAGGCGLEAAVGKKSLRLVDHYGAQVAAKAMRRKGYRVSIAENEQQEVITTCTK